MRHLHFTQSLEPLQGGGLGTSTTALHRQMLGAGIDSRLCATFSNARQNPTPGTFEFRRIGPGFLYYSPQLGRCAEELLKAVDVVHGHGLYVGTNYAFGGAARRLVKPLVYHVHGMFEPYILNRSRWKKRLVHWLFEDANFRSVRLWRALTNKEADQIRAIGIKAPVVIVPNGLDLREFKIPAQATGEIRTPWVERLNKKLPRLLFLGRLHPKKGLDLLLSVWAELAQCRKQWELVIAGPDEGGYLAELRRVAAMLGIDSQVCFTGAVRGETKKALLYSSDLFILPSYSEGFSMGLLEAMACGVPVVATHTCNFPEISSREAGWECQPSPLPLRQTLQRALAADPAERQQRGRNAQRLIEENYAWPSLIKRLIEACRACC